jgi:hypothetical protein
LCVVLEFECGASHLLGGPSTTWIMPPTLFSLVIGEKGSHFLPRPAWTTIFLF